jgi:hypothetical protein
MDAKKVHFDPEKNGVTSSTTFQKEGKTTIECNI